jgi:hypothetical protein
MNGWMDETVYTYCRFKTPRIIQMIISINLVMQDLASLLEFDRWTSLYTGQRR